MVVCGVQTPNCIRATAFDALSLDYNVIVPSDATASASQEVQQANLHGAAPFLVVLVTHCSYTRVLSR